MKPYLNFLCALLGATLCAASLAAAPAPQSAGCRIQLGGGGAVDYGKIKRNLLRAAEAAALPPQQRGLTITCDQPAAIALRQSGGDGSASAAAGSRLGVAPDASQGIGLASGKPLGAAVLRWRAATATVDGAPARLIVSSDGGATWREMEGDAATGANDLVAWALGGQRRPASGRALTVGVRIETAIAPTSTLYLGREALLDGSITLSAIFQ
ncbi:hypothetical protein APT56_20645 [Achromobacter denitrificans]|uniref:Uncharacterized protein n=1 Tax=Achromobacter ruhlandii TaxID=72557 RepID=A0A2M9GZ71_9BURK|nr:DUF1120 domain-containing protein [Achromobacter ruhlandii]ALX85412.1 hypothetical protein APT56_20645 [Achromobacter denitrificans]PJM69789.1 DUF1120 domain-containing protein [Achromobacter ruhlandii]CAB3868695.1 hypothetical protein LMG3328_02667 [Achromobacter ruhlandii]